MSLKHQGSSVQRGTCNKVYSRKNFHPCLKKSKGAVRKPPVSIRREVHTILHCSISVFHIGSQEHGVTAKSLKITYARIKHFMKTCTSKAELYRSCRRIFNAQEGDSILYTWFFLAFSLSENNQCSALSDGNALLKHHLSFPLVICGKAQKLYHVFYRFSARNKLLPALPPPVLSPLSYSQTHPIPP